MSLVGESRKIPDIIAGDDNNRTQVMDFEEQVRNVYPELMRYAHALEGNPADGDDLLQDSLVRAWRGYASLKDEAAFKPWILRIISNNHRSRRRFFWMRFRAPVELAAEIPADTPLPFEEKDAVRRAMQKLPRVQRDALILFEVLGMSVSEIADTQKVTPSAVKSRLARGRAQLRTEYFKLSGEEKENERKIARAV